MQHSTEREGMKEGPFVAKNRQAAGENDARRFSEKRALKFNRGFNYAACTQQPLEMAV